jgi:YHS domain-containing protein
MKRLIQAEKYEYYCDTCGIDLYKEIYGVPITIEFSYGHPLDGSEYHFCNYTCLLQFIIAELNKEKPNDKLYGKDK